MFKPYKYLKAGPVKAKSSAKRVIRLPKPPLLRRWVSAVMITSGLLLFTTQILLPWLTTPPAQPPLLKPTNLTVLGVDKSERPVDFVKVEFEFSELAQPPQPEATVSGARRTPKIFYLTIPKLEIERAEVETNSRNLSPDERLGHYAGSALPGEVGNTFIYGHSVLPMFYNPRNYRTIFSTLDKLEKGDEVKVEFGEKILRYVVEKAVVLRPEDVRPLEPTSPFFLRDSYLTLMTCVPMGLGTDRLLVQTRLVKEL